MAMVRSVRETGNGQVVASKPIVAAHRIARNATTYTLALVAKKLLTFVYLVIVARYAGVNVTGLFFLVLAYGTLFLTFSDFGLTSVFIRDTARRPEDCERNFSETLSVKLLLTSILLPLILVVLNVLDYPPITKNLTYIVVLSQILASLSQTFFGCFRAMQRLHYEAVGLVVGSVLTLSVCFLAVYLNLSVYYLIFAVALDGLFNFVFSAVLVATKLRIVPRVAITREVVFRLVPVALPFALSAIFMRIYSLDIVLVSRFMDETHVAWYSVASRLAGSMRLVPLALGTILFPVFSVSHYTDRERMVRTFQRSEYLLMWLVIPVAAGGLLLAAPIIEAIFGADYEQSVVPFQVMCMALIPIFLSYPLISLLNAIGGQKASAFNLAAAIAVHVAASVVLIPKMGIVGAALSFGVSNLTLLVLCQYSASRFAVAGWGSWGQWLKAIGLGTAAMAGTVWIVRDIVYLPLVIALGGMVYVGGTVLLIRWNWASSAGGFGERESIRELMAALRAIW